MPLLQLTADRLHLKHSSSLALVLALTHLASSLVIALASLLAALFPLVVLQHFVLRSSAPTSLDLLVVLAFTFLLRLALVELAVLPIGLVLFDLFLTFFFSFF